MLVFWLPFPCVFLSLAARNQYNDLLVPSFDPVELSWALLLSQVAFFLVN